MLGRTRYQLIFALGKVSRCGSLFDIGGSQQLLSSTHARERDTSLPQSIWLVWFGMVSFCVWYGVSQFFAACVGMRMGMVFFSGIVPHLPLVEILVNPEFHMIS